MYNIHLLPASFGDCILIKYGKADAPNYILIDGGPYFNFESMTAALKNRAPGLKHLELLVVTHVDIDHIDGIVMLLNQSPRPFSIGQVWFNGFEQLKPLLPADMLAVLQGDYLSMPIKDSGIPHNTLYFNGGAVMVADDKAPPVFELPGGMKITLLSPGRESLRQLAIKWEAESQYINDIAALREKFQVDTRYRQAGVLGDGIDIPTLMDADEVADKSVANESSIAFIGSYEDKSCLFSGDAPSDALLRTILPIIDGQGQEKLRIHAWKVAHHGSKKSTIGRLMQKVSAKNILISSDGAKYGHPNPETVAKLLKYADQELEFFFNYRTKFNEVWDNEDYKREYSYVTNFPKDGNGITLRL